MDNSARRSFDPSRLTKASAAEFSSSSSDEDEHILPNVDSDDNGFGEFKPRKRRRVGHNNKEKAALGVFASDSDDDRPGQRWKRKTLRDKGVSFIPTAAQGDGAGDDNDSGDENIVIGNGDASPYGSEDEHEEDSGADLGFGNTPRGLGWAGEEMKQEPSIAYPKPSLATSKTTFDGKGVLGSGFVPSSANEPVLKEPEAGTTPPLRNKPQPSAFGPKGKPNAKSFGARMMAKMGYVDGMGLGKEGQGRNAIVEANLRPQGIGLGAVKEKTEQERLEEKRQARLRGEDVVDSDEEEKKRRKAKRKSLGTAGSSAASTPRRQKTKYLTAEELKVSAPGLHIPDAFTPILDMTGPGGRMLTSTSGVMTPKSGMVESTDVTEARKLVKRAQADLRGFSEEWKSMEERKTWLKQEVKEQEQEIEDLRSDFERLQSFSALVTNGLMQDSDWNQVMGCLQKAAELGSLDAETADIAVAAIHPFLRSSDWDPLAEPARFASDLKLLSGLLTNPGLGRGSRSVEKWDSATARPDGIYRRHHKATTAYESMMYKNWLPRVLAAVRDWDALTPAPMLSVMEHWNDLVPPFVRAQVMGGIARKLETAVSDWNPRKKRQSHHLPHTWLFPWLQHLPPYHLDAKGTGLVADVRRKFRQLVDVWEFERGVVPGLQQWEEVLGDQWRALIMSHVLPSMGKYLRTKFRVDPAEQEPYLPILTGVLKWQHMLGGAIMGEVLAQDVLSGWYARLQEWLALEEADLGEVAEWYGWWRGVLLKDLAAIKGVGKEMDKGLQIMNLA